jgi:hypothetical protein
MMALPPSQEKRVVSFGLYGSNPKYTVGAIRNAQAAKVVFPGWVCRYYTDGSVPTEIMDQLAAEGNTEVGVVRIIRMYMHNGLQMYNGKSCVLYDVLCWCV